ncbi:adenylosuccinate synthetase [Bacteroidia bacterium]|nr:adenylosuccinate synthetase [Bacteroidia bacterium]
MGLQWGDEGKGKIVDVLTPGYDIIARFQGGPNAGHSLHMGKESYVLHTIPSGIFRPEAVNVIGNGVVIDPATFAREVEELEKVVPQIASKILISKKAHLILPTHRILDAAQEASKGADKIGSTLKGIGPTYTDKTSRGGMRVGDLLSDDFAGRYNTIKTRHLAQAGQYAGDFDLAQLELEFFDGVQVMRRFTLIDSEQYLNDALVEGRSALAEGAQGTMLDIDFGTYPFVTSSNTVCAGACTGLGVAPAAIGAVKGIFKAYCTRVGNGPFPTELEDGDGEAMRKVGREFGATTGRARRCGWLDMVALRYAVMVNGVTELIMMKADVLSGFDTIRVCTGYSVGGQTVTSFPYEFTADMKPVYRDFRGWRREIGDVRSYDELPAELKEYIEYIEKECGAPVGIVSVGPDRDQTIVRR